MDKQLLNSAALSAVDLLLKKCAQDCLYFITKFVHIEDRDSPELAVPFALWQGQIEALKVFLTARLSIVLKARQLGLTWLALAYATWRMAFNPGYAVVALSKKEDDAKELVRRVEFILRYLPKWMIQEKKLADPGFDGPVWESTTLSVTIYHQGGEPSTFKAMSSSPDSGRSFTANLVFLDEWAFQPWAEEIWTAAYPTINRPTGGQVIGLSTAKRGTLFEQIWVAARRKENGFATIFLSWRADPRRTQEWYEQTKKDLPNTYMQEYPETEEEAFSAGEGTAFPEFSRSIHVCEPFPIPDHWPRWIGHDPGYDNPFWWGWFAVDEDGTVYLYREYTRSPDDSKKVFYSEQAAKVAELSRKVTVNEDGEIVEGYEKVQYIVTGKDAFNKSRETGKTYIDYYYEGGLPRQFGFIPAITDRNLRKATMHEYLKPIPTKETAHLPLSEQKFRAKLQIFSTCTAIIDTLPKLVKDEHDSEKVEDNPMIDNPYDGCGYALISYHMKKAKPLPEDKGKIGIIKQNLAKKAAMHRMKRRIG